ncbi:hypothetical protein GLOTRDRAFT_105573 [Gloeophyllum trabeum ATCC 11539]|uniref:DUF6534 domain-containing protein n=1 Tax=Gloeophyllum trabeum (strain ATCC 11539 / FP-39264 / Madison 617) TaxID=670483 RepID=S7Q7T9_GLOTA|nr:uncharacterized protein GLOTRDRAFT_105573 [Gloeophyllum trabeum ATCC 11539]EPQ55508.1 hypothetical protein GLOTRDRAFT_105573 [Gloeophyllum trabeum ATCC 11539]
MGEFDTTIGILLLGLFFNTYLYGLVSWQFLIYHTTPFNDPWRVRLVVGALFILDTIHSAVAVYNGWYICVTNFNNPSVILTVSWEIPFTAVATSCAAIITQFFLAHRVLRLTKSWIITGIICTLSIIGFVFGVIAGVRSGIIQQVVNFGVLAPLVILWLGFQTAADLSITLVLSVALYRQRTGIRRTNTILNRLIRGAVQTGFFTSIFALGDLFGFLLHRNTNLYAMFAYPIGRIYTNTLLDTLNARVALKSLNGTPVDFDTESNALRFRATGTTDTINNNIRLQQVHVRQDVVAMTDSGTDRTADDKVIAGDDPEGLYTHGGKAV